MTVLTVYKEIWKSFRDWLSHAAFFATLHRNAVLVKAPRFIKQRTSDICRHAPDIIAASKFVDNPVVLQLQLVHFSGCFIDFRET
jgi:hypothetical protein